MVTSSRAFSHAQENHSQDILPDIKRYRQSIFKINYKLKQKAAEKHGTWRNLEQEPAVALETLAPLVPLCPLQQ